MTMDEEMESLQKNQTWDLVKLLEGKRVVECKWIFKKKSRLSIEEVVFHKARLVAKGYNKKEGVEYDDVQYTSIRVFLALVATLNMELEQLDVKTAFLHRRLEEDILMQ